MKKTYRKRIVRNKKTIKKRNAGGAKTHSRKVNAICTPIPAYTQLAAYVKSPHIATLQPYRSAGCDLYIDIDKDKDPHIHIHGYKQTEGQNGTYYYSISGKDIRNRAVPLLSKTAHGYESVLIEMYNALEGTNNELPSYISPLKSRSSYTASIRPEKPKGERPFPFLSDIADLKTKLGPDMGKHASRRDTSRLTIEDAYIRHE